MNVQTKKQPVFLYYWITGEIWNLRDGENLFSTPTPGDDYILYIYYSISYGMDEHGRMSPSPSQSQISWLNIHDNITYNII